MIEIKLVTIPIEPKFIAQKCVVCSGWGTVSFKRITCHACYGKGYLLIPINDREKNGNPEK